MEEVTGGLQPVGRWVDFNVTRCPIERNGGWAVDGGCEVPIIAMQCALAELHYRFMAIAGLGSRGVRCFLVGDRWACCFVA